MYIFDKISSLIWGKPLIALLLATGGFYTIKLNAPQFRLYRFMTDSSKNRNNSGLSQIRTVCMSLGAAMGTGNITGVAAAVAIGGAGAVFWMWISAFFGMAVVYAENYLSVLYSDKKSRGPMAYLEKGVGSKHLACAFAVMCVLASLGMGGMVQVNSFAESLGSLMPDHLLAAIMFLLIYAVISGGAKRIGTAAQTLLPPASAVYAVICFLVLIRNRSNIPGAFSSIFTEAFGFRQTVGGICGYGLSKAVSVGIRRGIFSNEAGLGSSPILHSAAESDSPYTQGMWSMFEVFFDTVLCCTLTALTLLASEKNTVTSAFSTVAGDSSAYIIAALMAVFAFCTIIGWYYCGESAYIYIFPDSPGKLFPLFFSLISAMGAVISADAVWAVSDIFNGMMAFPNLIGILLLNKKIKKE